MKKILFSLLFVVHSLSFGQAVPGYPWQPGQQLTSSAINAAFNARATYSSGALTKYSVLLGNGLGDIQPMSSFGSSGQFLSSSGASASPTWVTLPTNANPMTSVGDMIIGDVSGAMARLPVGSTSQILTVTAGSPAWSSALNSTTIGVTTPASIKGTSITATGNVINSNGSAAAPSSVFTSASTTGLYWANPGIGFSVAASSIGTMTGTGLNNMAIGATTPGTGAFTSLSATGNVAHSNGAAATPSSVFTGASTTGLYWANPGIGFSVAGSSVGTMTSTGLNSMAVGATTASTVRGTTLTATTGAITPSYPAGIVGNATGSAVTAGSIGEKVTSDVSGVSLVTGTAKTITSVNVSAGTWLLFANIYFVAAGTTTTQQIISSIGTVTNTLPDVILQSVLSVTFSAGQQAVLPTPTSTVTVSGSTPYYCVARSDFLISTMTARCSMTALRVG